MKSDYLDIIILTLLSIFIPHLKKIELIEIN